MGETRLESRQKTKRGQRRRRRAPLPPNVNTWERAASIAAGAGLVLAGIWRGRTPGLAIALLGGGLLYRGATGVSHVYRAFGIDTTRHKPTTSVPAQQGYKVERRLVIERPADDLFRYWRKLENLPAIMGHLVFVRPIDAHRSHWAAKGPLGTTIEWDAEIIGERENELIAWRSLEGSQVDTAGSVRFDRLPEGRGTILRVSLKYNPPAGRVGANIANLLGQGMEDQLDDDLRRFKEMMEAAHERMGDEGRR